MGIPGLFSNGSFEKRHALWRSRTSISVSTSISSLISLRTAHLKRDTNLTIGDFDLHFDEHFESHLLGNALYRAVSGYIGLYRAILGCIGLHWAVSGCIGLYWAVSGYIGLYWAVSGCIGLYWAILGCIRLYRAVLGYIGLYRAVLGCIGPKTQIHSEGDLARCKHTVKET